MVKLGVNIDHVATLRQARMGKFPDPLDAARVCVNAGADGITVHLREDRRHIQDQDVQRIRGQVKTKLNLEMSCASSIVQFALSVEPNDVCLVPEKRRELTTEGGLNILAEKGKITRVVRRLKNAGICVSLFVNADLRQIRAARDAGADCVELHTGSYAEAKNALQRRFEYRKLVRAAEAARNLGLVVNAGHGLDYANAVPVAKIRGMNELNIGFAIVSRALFAGLEGAVRQMKTLLARC